jgi:DNA-binding response OmpR family regulator
MARRILVIEPVASLRRAFAQILEDHGYDAVSVATLAEAAEVASSTTIDVAVVDERELARADDTFRSLRSGPLEGAVVLAICGDFRRRPQLLAAGVHCAIGKPVVERELVNALGWVLDVYRFDAA